MSISQRQVVAQTSLMRRDTVKFWREPSYHDLDCFHATFHNHKFSPHTHDTYVFGMIEAGVEFYRNQGCELRAPAGQALVLNPGDLHDGRSGEQGFTYRMFYPSVQLMLEAAEEIKGKACDRIPHFSNSLLQDQALAYQVQCAHRALERHPAKLARDHLVLETFTMLIQRHAEFRFGVNEPPNEKAMISKLRAYMLENLDRDISLQELSTYLDCSRFYLIRAFRKEVGMTPYAWLLNQRLLRSRTKLAKQIPLAEVAIDCGFFDQSHFTRVFKRCYGVTPGVFQTGCVS